MLLSIMRAAPWVTGLILICIPVAAAQESALATATRQLDQEIAALEAAPGPGDAFQRHLTLGIAYHRRGRHADALSQFDAAARLRSTASDVQVLRGLTLEALDRADDASRAFLAGWQRDAANPVKAYLVLTRTGVVDAETRSKALAVLGRSFQEILGGRYRAANPPFLTIDLIPDSNSRTPVFNAPDGRTALERGRAAEADGRLADAVGEYTSAASEAVTGRHAIYVGLGRIALVQGDVDGAIRAFARSVRLSPNDPILRRELAGAYIAAGREDEAFPELMAALLIAPENVEALAAVAQLYLDTDRPGEALPVLRRVLELRPQRHETYYALGTALSRAGRTEDAAKAFEQFTRLSSDALDARRRAVSGDAGLPEGR